jgi:hypothetical protein
MGQAMLRRIKIGGLARGVAFASLCVHAAPALACSPPPRPVRAPTPQEIERQVLESYRRNAALVEIEVLSNSSFTRPGLARVVHVYKGAARIGQQYRMRGVPGSACGHGDMTRGMRGSIYVGAEPPAFFPGFVSQDTLRILRRHGLAVRSVR